MVSSSGIWRHWSSSSGQLVATGNRYEPYQLRDPDGMPVVAVTVYFRDLLAVGGRAESTVRLYGMDLLRWFRFLVVRQWCRVGSGDSGRSP